MEEMETERGVARPVEELTNAAQAKPSEPYGRPGSCAFNRSAVQGSLFVLAGFGLSQLVRLLTNICLARTLFPGAFGIMALISSLFQGLQMFSDIGIGPSIIRSARGEAPEYLNTAWTLQLLRGTGVWLIACVIAATVAALGLNPVPPDTGTPPLSVLISVVGVTAIINGFTSTSVFSLNRHLKMGSIVAIDLAAQCLSSVFTLVWTSFDPSIWALVWGALMYSFVRVILSHAINPGSRNKFAWDTASAKELLHFGKWVFVSTIVSFCAAQMDRPILAKLASISDLGLYSIAGAFAGMAIEIANRLSNLVLYPILARHHDDAPLLIQLCLRSRSTLLWISGAIAASFSILSPLFFGLLYDERYAGAASLSQWFTIVIWTWILRSTMDRIPLAMGRPRELLLAGLVSCTGMALGVFGFRFGRIPGFLLGVAAGNVCAHLFLVLRLPCERRPMLIQSLVFTTAWTAYTTAVIYGLGQLSKFKGIGSFTARSIHLSPGAPWNFVSYGILATASAALPCILAGWILRHHVRSDFYVLSKSGSSVR